MSSISKILKQHGIFLAVHVACSTLISICTVYGTGLIANQITDLIAGKDIDIMTLIVYVVPLIIMATILALIGGRCIGRYSAIVVKESQQFITDVLLKAKNSFWNEESKGSLLSKMTSDIGELEKYTATTLPHILNNVVSIMVAGIYVGYHNIYMLIIPALLYPLIIMVMNYWGNILKELAKKRRGNIDSLVEQVSDGVAGIELVKTYNLYDLIVSKVNACIKVILDNEYKRAWIMHFSQTVSRFLFCIPNMVCPAFAFFMVIRGNMTISEMTVYILLINKILSCIKELPFNISDVKEKRIAVARLNRIAAAPVIEDEGYEITADGSFVLQNVSFRYDKEKTGLDHVSLHIEPYKTVAVVGMSGQGKSTIMRLLCGLEDEFEGKCVLSGKKALVTQKPQIFCGTIRDNIAIGNMDATNERIIESAKLAGIHDKIISLTDGYDTIIGENGAGLSGGEKQRICIARALVADADAILLDEPTSSVDRTTENIIMDTLNGLKGNKTIVMISHRLKLIRNADRIYVMDKGKIAQCGCHDSLVTQDGIYKQLWDMEVGDEA